MHQKAILWMPLKYHHLCANYGSRAAAKAQAFPMILKQQLGLQVSNSSCKSLVCCHVKGRMGAAEMAAHLSSRQYVQTSHYGLRCWHRLNENHPLHVFETLAGASCKCLVWQTAWGEGRVESSACIYTGKEVCILAVARVSLGWTQWGQLAEDGDAN